MAEWNTLALLTMLVIVVTICAELYGCHYRTYLRRKKRFTGKFWTPVYYPEEGEEYGFCDLCHGRLGTGKMALCACGGRYHPDCLKLSDCPACGNDLRHMRVRMTLVLRCPICMRRTSDGHCADCGITVPSADGTFRCPECGTKVMTSHPVCRKCGTRFSARTTKGYMDRVR